MNNYEDIDFSRIASIGFNSSYSDNLRRKNKLSYVDLQESVNNFADFCSSKKNLKTLRSPIAVFIFRCSKAMIWEKVEKPEGRKDEYDSLLKRRRDIEEARRAGRKFVKSIKAWTQRFDDEDLYVIEKMPGNISVMPRFMRTIVSYLAFVEQNKESMDVVLKNSPWVNFEHTLKENIDEYKRRSY